MVCGGCLKFLEIVEEMVCRFLGNVSLEFFYVYKCCEIMCFG